MWMLAVRETTKRIWKAISRVTVISVLLSVLLLSGFIVGGNVPVERETPPPPKVEELKDKFRSAMIVDSDENTTIQVSLPKCDNASLNALIKQYAEYIVGDFRRTVQPEEKASLEVTYQLFFRQNRIFSILYRTKAKKGEAQTQNCYAAVYSYDKGKQFDFTDLFSQKSDYLGSLSNVVKGKITAEKLLGEGDHTETLESVLAPAVKNFRRMAVDEETLVFVYPPGFFSPDQLQPLTVRVPLSELAVEMIFDHPSIAAFEVPIETTETTTTAAPTTEETTEETTTKPPDTETAAKETQPPAEPPTNPGGGGKVALTFDDGPSDQTGRLLDALAARGARATFFVVGNRVGRYPNTMKRIADEGHCLGNHSYSHADLTKLSAEEALGEINTTDAAILEITGSTSQLLRPPYGAYNDTLKSVSPYPIILWSLDTRDWKNRDSTIVCNRIVEGAREGSIILLHDLYSSSVDGAVMAIDILQQQGYEFVTVPELFASRGASVGAGDVVGHS